jgi:hypothetical protein
VNPYGTQRRLCIRPGSGRKNTSRYFKSTKKIVTRGYAKNGLREREKRIFSEVFRKKLKILFRF